MTTVVMFLFSVPVGYLLLTTLDPGPVVAGLVTVLVVGAGVVVGRVVGNRVETLRGQQS